MWHGLTELMMIRWSCVWFRRAETFADIWPCGLSVFYGGIDHSECMRVVSLIRSSLFCVICVPNPRPWILSPAPPQLCSASDGLITQLWYYTGPDNQTRIQGFKNTNTYMFNSVKAIRSYISGCCKGPADIIKSYSNYTILEKNKK